MNIIYTNYISDRKVNPLTCDLFTTFVRRRLKKRKKKKTLPTTGEILKQTSLPHPSASPSPSSSSSVQPPLDP